MAWKCRYCPKVFRGRKAAEHCRKHMGKCSKNPRNNGMNKGMEKTVHTYPKPKKRGS